MTEKNNVDWKKSLTSEQYNVTREKGTEKPFTGEYDNFYEEGFYKCVCCGNELFSSFHKYNSGTGWPSFYKAVSDKVLKTDEDCSMGRVRTEILCSNCDAHIGHVFDDGPQPTNKRFCTNSVALKFSKKEK